MMAPVEEHVATATEEEEPRRKDGGQQSEQDGGGNQQQHGEDAGGRGGGAEQRSRQRSDAAKREDRESQRAEMHEQKKRMSLLNNRFLQQRRESRASSGGGGGRGGAALPKKTETKGRTQRTQQQPEDDGGPEEEKEEEKEEEEEEDVERGVVASALVATRQRSFAAPSSAAKERATRGRRRQQSTHARGDTADSGDHGGQFVITPSRHVVPAFVLPRSKWTRELDEDAACGLFVEHERRELAQIASSTLVRLEERLQRELSALAHHENEPKRAANRRVRLNDLVHAPAQGSADDRPIHATASSQRLHASDARRTTTPHGRVEWTPAVLEITIERLVLDDHASFSLADRVETQLRSLHSSYTQLVHAQPWVALLQRIHAYVESRLEVSQAPTRPQDHRKWLAQTFADAQTLLQSLSTLQQLHCQLLTTWHELQDCYRQPSLAHRTAKLRVAHEPRAVSLTTATVHAFLELGDGDAGDEDYSVANAKLTEKLAELEIQDQYLHVVLRLEALPGDATHAPTASRARFPRSALCSLTSCWPGMSISPLPLGVPAFYVALFINGKQVGRTRAASWMPPTQSRKARPVGTVGVVAFGETLRARLQCFPESATLRVFERGLLVDALLSTSAIPLLVPGHDLVGSGSPAEPHSRVAAASLAPSAEWYQFSGARAIARAKWHATFLNSSRLATCERRPRGRVRVRVAWVAPPSARPRGAPIGETDDWLTETANVVLPPRRAAVAARDNAKLVGPRVDRRRLYQSDDAATEHFGRKRDARHATFSYERDFLVHVAPDAQLAVDRNDPQNADVVRLQDHVRAQSALLRQRDVFRAASLAFDSPLALGASSFSSSSSFSGGGRAALTTRNLLLQLRDREHAAKHGTSAAVAAANAPLSIKWDHAAFDDPLPLSEHELTASAAFLSLLRPEIPAFDHQQRVDDALAAGGDARVSVERQHKLRLLKLHDFAERAKASQLVRAHVKSARPSRATTKTLASILQEQPLPLLPGALDLSGLTSLFSRRRRLRPRVEKRHAPATAADWPRHCTLYVQVKSATNVPMRATPGVAQLRDTAAAASPRARRTTAKATRDGGATTDEDDDGRQQQQQKTTATAAAAATDSSHVFVEISFQGRRRRTTSALARAASAVWMESVALPFHAPLDDWSPESLQKAADVVRLSLFDQLVRPAAADKESDGDGDSDAHAAQLLLVAADQQRVQSFHQEHRFLGSLEIPFAALYQNGGTLDATLRCATPVVNVGYVNARHADDGDGDGDRDDDGVAQRSREATSLSVMLTLEPLLPLPVKAFEPHALGGGTASGSDDDRHAALAAYAAHWTAATRALHAATRRRDFHVFVRNLSHGQTFLTRYVTPQAPPPLLATTTRTAVSPLVRFVQLIPCLDDGQLFAGGGELDVWTTSQELLELHAGDCEEHAVLLCNLFLWLDRDAPHRRSFLVLARAVPEGTTVYVLRQDTATTPPRSVLWNASAGEGFSVLDDRCPVLDVSLVVSADNIYANVQPARRLSDMNWDVATNAKAWKPFFHGAVTKQQFTLPTVQTCELAYGETPSELGELLERELRETLKLEIRRWRSAKYTTTFNMDLSLRLRGELERLERALLDGVGDRRRKEDAAGESDPIAQLQRTRRVSGLPLNASFTDVDKIVAMVKNTNVYWNGHDEVEFALAVYVHAYPNCVLSVWVYLVAVEPLV